jgi:hypothetical protein
MPVCQLLIIFLLFKIEICFDKAQNTIRPFQYLLESNFFVCLKIPLLPDLYKIFFSVCYRSTASQAQPDSRVHPV